MKIWHVGASSNPFRVDGVSRTVWLLSREQARLGHDVSLVIDSAPEPAAIELSRKSNIKLVHVDATHWSYPREIRRILAAEKPQVVHMHSVFIVRQATLGRILNKAGIPYLITPHGGLAPQVLRRGILKKSIYTALRERPRFMGASAIALVTPAEERAVRAFVPNFRKPIRWMPNPVEVEQLDPYRWQGLQNSKRVVFLGRFDVLVKGIDVLIGIARLAPEIKFDLYGTEDPKTLDWLNELKKDLPANVEFHAPVFGEEKAKMLSQASFYIQPSRWEGFPVSVAECQYLGVPCAIADTLDLAQLFFQYDLGLVISLNPASAVSQLKAALAKPQRLEEWSMISRQFAVKHFHPANVALKHIEFYSQIVSASNRVTTAGGIAVPHNGNGHADAPRNSHHAPAPTGRGVMPTNVRGIVKNNFTQMYERSTRLFGHQNVPRTVVLCYHSVNKSEADLSIDPNVFRNQIVSLKEMGYQFLNFGELVQQMMRVGTPRGNVACITFDDGYLDNLTQAAPILNELGVPATTFVTTGLMLREPVVLDRFQSLTRYQSNYLSPSEVRELQQAGFEIGAHTHSHANLARQSFLQVRHEVDHSKMLLEEALGSSVRSFAYPFGKRNIHYTPENISAIRESGFKGAAAVAFRPVSGRESIKLFEVPRFFITRSDAMDGFQQKISGQLDWLGSIQEGTPAWLKALVSPEDKY